MAAQLPSNMTSIAAIDALILRCERYLATLREKRIYRAYSTERWVNY